MYTYVTTCKNDKIKFKKRKSHQVVNHLKKLAHSVVRVS
jgi:hypothetical protein